ncbi:MAG: hypothetical protein JWL57_43 [Actinobacteria bacterium]|nr:hypothetical protein [Actinomycetota bacterium]
MSEAEGAAPLKAPASVPGPSLHAVPEGRNAVKGSLTPKGRERVVENPEFAAFARRILRAAARRVADGDVEGLPGLVALRSEVEAAIGEAIGGLRSPQWSYSWADIARVLGTTRQAAQQRYGGAS